jgi:hypothetical protein
MHSQKNSIIIPVRVRISCQITWSFMYQTLSHSNRIKREIWKREKLTKRRIIVTLERKWQPHPQWGKESRGRFSC